VKCRGKRFSPKKSGGRIKIQGKSRFEVSGADERK
jgi:hypothetical protein